MPVRLSDGSRANCRMRMPVSSLCSTSPCAACQISWSKAGFSNCRPLFHQFPLRGRRQRNPHLRFHPFEPCEWHASAVLELRDHRDGCGVVLVRTDAFRLFRREHLSAGVAAQPLHLIHGCFHRRLSHHPHQRLRLPLRVHSASCALRAGIATSELRLDDDLSRSRVRAGAVASMSLACGMTRRDPPIARQRCRQASVARTTVRVFSVVRVGLSRSSSTSSATFSFR